MLVSRLGDPDFVKVLDFGLAKFMDTGSAQLTAAGVVLGTPQYMSPEACESKKDLDQRTDIYAVGVLLFQMVCGQLPFDGQTMGEVLVKQVTQPPPAPRGINAAIPPSVEQIILRCLSKSRDGRFATMSMLREVLLDPDAYLSSSPPIMPARSVPPGMAPADARTLIAQVRAHNAASGYGPTAMHGASPDGMAQTMMSTSGMPSPAAAGAPTMIGKVSAARPTADMPPPLTLDGGPLIDTGRVAKVPPALTMPVPAQNNTMIIATPMGYSSKPPRGGWAIGMVIVLLAAMVGGGIYVALGTKKDDAGGGAAAGGGGEASAAAIDAGVTVTAIEEDAAPGAPAPFDAAAVVGSVTQPDAAVAAANGAGVGSGSDAGDGSAKPTTPMFKVEIVTDPDGAEVLRKLRRLGKTPLVITLDPNKLPVVLEIKKAGFKPVKTTIERAGDVTIREQLIRVLTPGKGGKGGKGGGKGGKGGSGKGSSDGLIDPDT
jgi:hypothetical protein